MNYSDTRPKIKSGDVLAWTHRSWGTWYDFQVQMVRFFTQSEYSHVGVAYTLGDRVFVLESVGSGIRMFPLSQAGSFYWLSLDTKWTDDTLNAAMSKIGQTYSKWDGIRSLFVKLKPGADGKWECAEYTSFILQNAGIDIDCRNVPSEVIYWLQENENCVMTMVKN